MNNALFLNIEKFYSYENLKRFCFSEQTIREIMKLMDIEKNRLKEIDKKLEKILDIKNEEIFNEKMVKEYYIRNYRKFKFKIEEKAKINFGFKFYESIKLNDKQDFNFDDFSKEFIQIVLRPNYIDLSIISKENFSNVNMTLLSINKYFFDFIKLNELTGVIYYFQQKKIIAYKINGKFFNSIYLKQKNDEIMENELKQITNGKNKMEIVNLYKFVSKMMGFMVYGYAFNNFNYFNLNYDFSYESCFATFIFFEYCFGELVTSILYAYLNINNLVEIEKIKFHKNISLDSQFIH